MASTLRAGRLHDQFRIGLSNQRQQSSYGFLRGAVLFFSRPRLHPRRENYAQIKSPGSLSFGTAALQAW